MQHPIVPFAHAAFCTGFAASGGPITDRVRAAHKAAIETAIEHEDHPGIIEATLNIGKLEGLWAKIYARRTDLFDTSIADFSSAWKKLWPPEGLAAAMLAIRQHAGPIEKDKQRSASAEWVAGIILALLQQLISRSAWQELRLAVGDALASGRATGAADAMELLADKIDVVGFDFDKAFADAKHAFDHDPQMLAQVDQWLSALLQDVAGNAAKKLAQMASDGNDADDMEEWLDSQLGEGDSHWFAQMIGGLVNTAITFGILWFYRNQGVAQVWFVTAGDDLVCPQCDEIEQENPYPITDPPEPPIHGNCRCSLVSDDEISGSSISDYLP